ncbi:hypothetical protein [Mycobacterium sp. AT1]|uniref:hypothetical protein n=1 Tax=Mycobacterium sp. AT1 TaxID=1961706 RepID=UPI001E490687|nr:hypothetical protein [Mycobacterium sp. AT1]
MSTTHWSVTSNGPASTWSALAKSAARAGPIVSLPCRSASARSCAYAANAVALRSARPNITDAACCDRPDHAFVSGMRWQESSKSFTASATVVAPAETAVADVVNESGFQPRRVDRDGSIV